ncbi:hypothetical protein MIND_01242400 [Mycena indigotica]|uniref:Guanine nucleotide-binding protein alpha-4 subunit n=1 Tax=Mycena indigotica TaxID=2126181 RepID=A0A8H6VSF8_9AGAR|nr:uncharacterized protein MIND_01242400 [Mycena indigotica]KAF7292154.1 hypothetical protein MIND_01242400 [Mycena indigotica]
MAARVFRGTVGGDMDPFAAALEPPANESPAQRQARMVQERVAKQTSDDIDEQIGREKRDARRQGKPVKILLLGQSESGKSTTLKNFQLMCEPKAFRAERASWRAIIHLNVIRSIRIILDALAHAQINSSPIIPAFGDSPRSSYASGSISGSEGRNSYQSSINSRPDMDLMSLRARLVPLLALEDELTRQIANPDPDATQPETPSTARSLSPPSPFSGFRRRAGKEKEREVAVNLNSSKRTFFHSRNNTMSDRASLDTQHMVDWDDPNEPGALLHASSDDLQRLWAHPAVKEVLARRGLRLQEESGFFLDELKEVTAPRYVPTDEHILRARLKTLGVSEHRMRLNDPNGAITREFRIFDVGGQRSMVSVTSRLRLHSLPFPLIFGGASCLLNFPRPPRWVPYFDDMDAIIFLAPISAFDQALVEDRRVNRLADSLDLWAQVITHPLLAKTNIILFMNKIDLMQAKLAAGVRLADFYPAYGRRPNDFDSASKFLKKQFGAILKQKSPVPRIFYCHLTHVIEAKTTTLVLAGIKDMLMRSHLKESHLIL